MQLIYLRSSINIILENSDESNDDNMDIIEKASSVKTKGFLEKLTERVKEFLENAE